MASRGMASAGELWGTYVEWLAAHAPAAQANLAPPASEEALARVERRLNVALPEDVKLVLRMNDGQRATMVATSATPAPVCLPSLSFLSTSLILEVWEEWETLRRETTAETMENLNSAASSAEPMVVRPLYTHPKWVPLWSDPMRADYVGLDLDPAENGTMGQIINFGRNEERHFVFARSFAALLEILVEEVHAGRWSPTVFHAASGEVPWLGKPEDHFFNALHARWKAARGPTPQERLKELETKARRAKMHGDLEVAFAATTEAEALFPKHVPLLVLAAEIAIGLLRFDEAERRYAIVTEKAPRLSQHFFARIHNLVDGVGDRARAAELLQTRLANDPDDKKARALLEKLGGS